jgi:hypothetical protein
MADQGTSNRMQEQRGSQQRGAQGQQSGQFSKMGQSEHQQMQMGEMGNDIICYLTDYAKQNPGYAALWCLGIGFVLGWKLKPW